MKDGAAPYSRGRSLDIRAALAIAIVWVAMAIVASPIGDFPLNDDWTYARAVEALLETGRVSLPVETYADAVPQVFWGALFCLPFGFSFVALRLSTLTLGLIGVLALYALALELGATRRIALLAALTLAVSPLYLGLSVTFMTDVPFAALLTISVFLLVRSLLRDSPTTLALGLAAALAAMLVRQFGIVVVVAFAVAFVVRYRFDRRRGYLAVLLVAGALAAEMAVDAWLSARSGGIQTSRPALGELLRALVTMGSDSLRSLVASIIYLGWLALPLLAATNAPAHPRLSRRARLAIDGFAIAMGTVLFVAVVLYGLWLPSLTNVIISTGIGPLTLHDTYILLTNQPTVPQALAAFWILATAGGIVGAGLLMRQLVIAAAQDSFTVIAEQRRQDLAARVFVVLAAAGYALILGVFANFSGLFDRYLLPLLPLILALVAALDDSRTRATTAASSAVAGVLIAVSAGFSAVAAHDYVAWNQTRWTALSWLTDHEHIAPQRIDGGYEFNGWYLYDARYRASPGKSWWWVVDDEYVVAAGPLPGYYEVGRYTVSRWLPGTKSEIVVLRRAEPGH